MARKLLKIWLRYLAAKVLKKYCPRIVAITGSTGKTSTKEAILAVLRGADAASRIVGTRGNLNTEFGVTATIIDPRFIGTDVQGKIKLAWRDVWQLTWRAGQLLFRKLPYPKILVLELAADHPGDIKYFMNFIRPEVGVLTNIGDVHLEFYGSKSELVEEKSLVISHIKPRGLAVLNKDDDFSKLISRKTSARKVFVSTEVAADLWASDLGFGSAGVHFNAMSGQQIRGHIDLPVYGYQFIYAALMALAVGDHFHVAWEAMVKRLGKLTLPSSRFEVIKLGNLVVIDDTYNANPTSMIAALKSLARLGVNRRKIAVLGDMRELGSAHAKGHQSVGEYAAKVVDELWIVGEGGALIRQAALLAGLSPNRIREFFVSAIPLILQDNSIVLVKGSRAVGMGRIVELMKQYYHERHHQNHY